MTANRRAAALAIVLVFATPLFSERTDAAEPARAPPNVTALAIAAPAAGATMHLLGAEPRPNQVMSGSGVAFALHFDHPLDHQASRFMLVGADGARRTVPVRLGAQPSVLYGSVGQLPPGRYTLNWSAQASNGAALSGTLPFTVDAAH